MKTKLKTSPKSQKQSILENSNFLNNQNYILGNSEKKKLLSKFFVENNILFILNIVYKFKQVINFQITKKIKSDYLTPMVPLYSMFIIYMGYSIIPEIVINSLYLLFLYTYFLIFIGIMLPVFLIKYLYIKRNKLLKIKTLIEITSLKNLIFSKTATLGGLILRTLFVFLPIISLISFIGSEDYTPLIILILFIAGLFFLEFLIKITKIKFITLLFLPLFIILEIFYIIYVSFKNLVFNTNRYTFIKVGFKRNLINKFLLLDKNYAENKYYKITKK